ncbi:MAG TPA: hypothetical protein PLZ84_01300 [Clostridia bacterium]|nr:hypothetical protein [Clostridia bacterium]
MMAETIKESIQEEMAKHQELLKVLEAQINQVAGAIAVLDKLKKKIEAAEQKEQKEQCKGKPKPEKSNDSA